MITDADIDKMEKRFSKIFATKKELKTETERIVKLMTDEFRTVIEMIGDTNERMDKRFDEVNKRLDGQSKQLGEQNKKLTENNQRLEENNTILPPIARSNKNS